MTKAATGLIDGDHVVQFYGDDDDLGDVVVGYLVAAVLDGDAVVVIATPEHREQFTAGVRRAGVDIEEAASSGRLQVYDAAELLGTFMVSGMADVQAFRRSVGGAIEAAGAGNRAVRAYGEMVAVLWSGGNRRAAIQLERLWNGLSDELPFALLCAYPVAAVNAPTDAGDFEHVCHLHTYVVAGAPTPPNAQLSRRFAGTADGPRLARAFAADALRSWGLSDRVDDCLVVVSELTTNAVRHAASDFTLSLSRTGDVIQIVVGDTSAVLPKPRAPARSDPGGRGLQLVAAIADDWGHLAVENGKLVWAHLGIPA